MSTFFQHVFEMFFFFFLTVWNKLWSRHWTVGKIIESGAISLLIWPSDHAGMIAQFEECINDFQHVWLTLMLNDTKTELLHMKPRYAGIVHTDIGNKIISPSLKVCNLGVVFDDNIMMKILSHVNNVSRHASFAIRQIGEPHRYLDSDNTLKFLSVLPKRNSPRLLHLQNMAAWIVTLSRKSDTNAYHAQLYCAQQWCFISCWINLLV